MENYKIVISIGEHSVEISSHDKEWVESKLIEYKKLFLDDGVNSKINSKDLKLKVEQNEKTAIESYSVNEFYKKNISGKIKSRPEIATFFVYFLTKSLGKKEFSTGEIKEQFREVGYPGWNSINIADTLSQAKRRALLNNFNNQWSLSITGEDFILNKLLNEDQN